MADYNIGNVLDQVADKMEGKIGLAAPVRGRWQTWSFVELAHIARTLNCQLDAQEVGRGDRVMLMVRPSVEFICLTFALFQLGAVVILIDPGMGYRNLLRCIGSVRPDILVGIPKAIIFSKLFPRPFASLRKRICVGTLVGWSGPQVDVGSSTRDGVTNCQGRHFSATADDLAAIIFTTGSTGPPKGVQYTHGIFHTQLQFIRDYFGIASGDVDQPGFPLFGLFSIALGATAVIPDMDPTRPAKVDPQTFVASLMRYRVSYSFGSPAIWRVVGRYCEQHGVQLPVKKILMAGAPVPGALIKQLQRLMPEGGEIFIPYGATESLPVAAIEGREVVEETWEKTRKGKGTCVGRALPGIAITIIAPVDGPLRHWREVAEQPPFTIGEIAVKGPVVTRAYDNNTLETEYSKITDDDGFWHRMGDMGYLDEHGRLWFCGRKAHRVLSARGILYTIPCEAIFNEHPEVYRSALVGVGKVGCQRPVVIVEPIGKVTNLQRLLHDLETLAAANPLTAEIETFLIHTKFPVDIRHNAKIFREKLALWAERKLRYRHC